MAGARVIRRLHRRLATRRGAAVATLLALLAVVVVGLSVGACRTTGRPVEREARGAGFEPEMRVRLTRTAERVALDGDGAIILTAMGAPNAPPVRVAPPLELRIDDGAIIAVELATPARPAERVIRVHGAPIVAVDGESGAVRVEGVPHAGALEAIAR
ncbi:MAG: hypothetical protein ACF8QF_11100, partial [Phycisphaerales bacterium]